jgi:hypothetical protein
MQYVRLALSLAWPEILIAVLWLAVLLLALRYALATRRPIFLFSGIAALLLTVSAVLSPARAAYLYFSHRTFCYGVDDCTVQLLFGAAKYKWVLDGLAALLLLVGLFVEVSRARRRAAARNAARANTAANAAMSAPPAGGDAPAGEFANQYPGGFVGQYQAAPASDLAPSPESERPTSYG